MWKLESFKKRKLVLEVNDYIECNAVEHVIFSEDELASIIDTYSKKYPHPRYELAFLEILDLDWREDKL